MQIYTLVYFREIIINVILKCTLIGILDKEVGNDMCQVQPAQ